MLRMTPRRTAVAVALAAVLALTSSAPAFAVGRPGSPSAGSLLERAWSWLGDLAGLTVFRGEVGSFIDPDGAKTQAVPVGSGLTPLRGEAGSFIDPNGNSLQAASPAAPSHG